MVGAFTMTCRFCNSRSVLVPAALVPNVSRTTSNTPRLRF